MLALLLAFPVTSTWAIDVANQADWNAAMGAVAAATSGSTVSINVTSGFSLSSSLAAIQASAANVTVNINGAGAVINGGSAYQGLVVQGAQSPVVTISNLAVINTVARGGNGAAGQNGYFSAGLAYGSGGGGGGGVGAGGGLLVGSGAAVTLSSVSFTGNAAQGGNGGNGGVAQNAAADPVNGGNGGAGGTMNGGGTSGGGGAGGVGGHAGTQGTVGSAGAAVGDGGGGGGGSGTTNSTAYTSNNNGGAGNAGGGTGGRNGDGVTNNQGSQGPGSDGGSGGGGGAARGGAIYVATGGTLTILDTPISGATVTGGAGGSAGVGQGPSSINGSVGSAGAGLGGAIFLNGASANIGVSSGTVTYANTISGTGLTTGAVNTAINKTGAGTLALSAANDFTGNVNIAAGTVSIASTGNLGNINNDVVMSDGATLSVTGTTTLASGRAFFLAGSSTIGVADNTTTTLQGVIGNGASAGSLVKAGGGSLTLTGVNTYTGATTIDSGTLALSPTGTIANSSEVVANGNFDISGTTGGATIKSLSGAGTVAMGSKTLTLSAATGAFAGVLSGTGGLIKQGAGTQVFSGANSYTGGTNVTAGTLRAGAINSFSALSAHQVASGATLDLAGYSQTVAALTNAGTVSLLASTPGTRLTVTGAYVGQGGTLAIGTVLGADASLSDQLVLDGAGASATGTTQLAVTNIGGLGAQTVGSGIPVVLALNGATSAAGAFALNGTHVDAGAFQYRLVADANNSWYLTSTTTAVTPVIPETPVIPDAPVAPVPAPVPVPVPVPGYRAEVALHNALPNILRQSDLGMLSTQQLRVGDVRRTAPAAGAGVDRDGAARSAWARVIGSDAELAQSGAAGVVSHSRLHGVQTGVDLYASNTWKAGLYAGFLHTEGHVDGLVGGVMGEAGSFSINSTYAGAYGTYTSAQDFYASVVLQYGRHGVSTSTTRTNSHGDADSLATSLEVGQRFKLGLGWAIEPQAQLIHNHTKLDAVDIIGASVQQHADNQWITRLGLRMSTELATSQGVLQPYGRVNVWHGFSGTDTTSFVNTAATTPIETKVGYTSTEVALGATLQLTPAASVYGDLGRMFKIGGNGDSQVKSSVQGSVGFRLLF